jgi:hypothetical protein
MRGARSSVPCGESFLGLLVSAVGASPDEPTQVAICRWVQGFHLDAYIVWLCCASSFSWLMRGVRSSVPCGKSFLGLLVSAVGASPNEPTQVAICRWVQGLHLDAYIVWLCCASSFSRLMRGVRSSVPCGKSFLGLLVSAVDASPNEPTQVAIGRWVVWYCSGG